MRTVFLLTGFQNWGKTFLIRELFSKQKVFQKKKLYKYSDKLFCVLPMSNDDLGQKRYELAYRERISVLSNLGKHPRHIISAFCPTKEEGTNPNRSEEIIRNLYSGDRVIMIPIEYKWCRHAKLELEEIKHYYSHLPNVAIEPLKEKDPKIKILELKQLMAKYLDD